MSKQSSTLLVVVLVVIVAFFVVSSKQPSLLGYAAKTNMQEDSYQKQLEEYTSIANSYDGNSHLENFGKPPYEDNPAGSSFVPPQPAPASRDQYLDGVASQKQQLISALENGRKPNCREVPIIFRKYLTGC